MRAPWHAALSAGLLAALLVAGQAPPCSSDECDTEDMSALQRDVRQRPAQPGLLRQRASAAAAEEPAFEVPDLGEGAALGLLILTYGYPTQPGDIDDKRSFCTVDKDYKCTDGFSLVKAEVHGLTFGVAQSGDWNQALNVSFTNAVRALVKEERVRAITANCGFMTNYLEQVKDIMKSLHMREKTRMLPVVMGTLELGNVFTKQTGSMDGTVPGWGLLEKHDRALVVTANSESLSPRFWAIMDKAGIEDPALKALLGSRNITSAHTDKLRHVLSFFGVEDPSLSIGEMMASLTTVLKTHPVGFELLKNSGQYFRTYGAQAVQGFGDEVAGGAAHNASAASPHMVQWVLDSLFRIEYYQPVWTKNKGEVKATFVLMECTELPAYSNAVRMATRLPVWDITTVAQCLMAAAPSYSADEGDITENTAFRACMESWLAPYTFEKRFGKQLDRSIKWYDDEDTGSGPARRLQDFDWGLLGKPEGERCTAEVGCT